MAEVGSHSCRCLSFVSMEMLNEKWGSSREVGRLSRMWSALKIRGSFPKMHLYPVTWDPVFERDAWKLSLQYDLSIVPKHRRKESENPKRLPIFGPYLRAALDSTLTTISSLEKQQRQNIWEREQANNLSFATFWPTIHLPFEKLRYT